MPDSICRRCHFFFGWENPHCGISWPLSSSLFLRAGRQTKDVWLCIRFVVWICRSLVQVWGVGKQKPAQLDVLSFFPGISLVHTSAKHAHRWSLHRDCTKAAPLWLAGMHHILEIDYSGDCLSLWNRIKS